MNIFWNFIILTTYFIILTNIETNFVVNFREILHEKWRLEKIDCGSVASTTLFYTIINK